MEEKVIHAEDKFGEHEDIQMAMDALVVTIHTVSVLACIAGSKKLVNKYIDIPGFSGSMLRVAGTMALANLLEEHLPLSCIAEKALRRINNKILINKLRKEMEENNGGEADNDGTEETE